MTQHEKVYRIVYPMLFALCALRLGMADFARQGLSTIGFISSEGQMTWLMYGAVACICLLLAVFAGRIYRADIDLVYGQEIQKLKALIGELESLCESTSAK